MPMPDASLCLSWDDGHPADRRVADLMLRHGLRGTFFVPLSNVEGRPVLTAQDLRGLSGQGFEIGAHGVDHRRLTSLPRPQARQQVVDGKKRLEDMLGKPVAGFCYPGGRHDAFIRAAVAENGFSYGRTTEMFRLDAGADPYRMPTTMQLYPNGAAVLLRNWLRQGSGAARLDLAWRQWRAADLPAHAGRLAGEAAGRAGGVLHLWGHSWEIDAADRWGWLDAILAAVVAVPHLRRATCAELVP